MRLSRIGVCCIVLALCGGGLGVGPAQAAETKDATYASPEDCNNPSGANGSEIEFVYAWAPDSADNSGSLLTYMSNTVKYFVKVLDFSSGPRYDQDWRFECGGNSFADIGVVPLTTPVNGTDEGLDPAGTKLNVDDVIRELKVAGKDWSLSSQRVYSVWLDIDPGECMASKNGHNTASTDDDTLDCINGGTARENHYGVVALPGSRPATAPLKSELHEITHVLVDTPFHCKDGGDAVPEGRDPSDPTVAGTQGFNEQTGDKTAAGTGNDRDCAVDVLGDDRHSQDPGYNAAPGEGLCSPVQLDCDKDDYYSAAEAYGGPNQLDPSSSDACTDTTNNHGSVGLCNLAESPYLANLQETSGALCFDRSATTGTEVPDRFELGAITVASLDGRDFIDDRGRYQTNFFCSGDSDDTIHGGASPDNIAAGAGADSIFGGPGGDVIYDGPGPDYIEGGQGTDDIVYWCDDNGDGARQTSEARGIEVETWVKGICAAENFKSSDYDDIIEKGYNGSGI